MPTNDFQMALVTRDNHKTATYVQRNGLRMQVMFEATAGARLASLVGAANHGAQPVHPSDVAAVCAGFSGVGGAGALA